MKNTLIAAVAATVGLAGAAQAETAGKEPVKIGVIFGYTGPIESLTPSMAASAEMAMTEVNDAGGILGGHTVTSVRGDSTCIDAAAANAVAERLITSDGVQGIVGAACSGVTISILQNVAMPNGIAMISPSATSPALTDIDDNGLFFRTAPSDARQGVVAAEILREKGVEEIAITYTNNDYGKGLADSIAQNFTAAGGTVTITASHEDGKADYSAEVGALASGGGDVLVVAGYVDQGGQGIIRSSIDSGAFDTFYLPDGMIGDVLIENFGADLDGSYGAAPGSDSPGQAKFLERAEAEGFVQGQFTSESYDAAALMILAMEAAGSTKSADYASKVMDVANAPGEKIFPGDLGKALEIIRAGGDIDYVGATAVELIGPGESAGSYRQLEIKDQVLTTVGYR